MWAIITGIVKLFGEFFRYVADKQLLDAGSAIEAQKQAKVAEQARDELFAINRAIATDHDKRQQLRDKWTKKDS